MKEIGIRTNSRAELVDITAKVGEAVKESGVKQGWAAVFVLHTTAGITINENADPDVRDDILSTLEKLVPRNAGYAHREGNADSHVKASLMGLSVTVPVSDGRLVLGTWQGIYFCEFDGPRQRRVIVDIAPT